MDDRQDERGASQPLTASQGRGPLVQRDYWAVISNCRYSPPELAREVAESFGCFAPPELVRFARAGDRAGGLEPGEELAVSIRGAGRAAVRVAHRDPNSITLITLPGHPEAGRITFGAYRNDRGDVVFHIRSRARSSSGMRRFGFVTLGDAMQTDAWVDYINRLAVMCGDGIVGAIHASSRNVEESEDDGAAGVHRPTFLARGD